MATPRAPFVAPYFYRATGAQNFNFPYATLNDQLKDAQTQWQNGAAGWSNQFNPQLQTVKNTPVGGLLGYFNNLFAKNGAPSGGGLLNPPPTGGPLPRGPTLNWNGDPMPGGPIDPNRTSRTGTPTTPWTPDGRTSRTGGAMPPAPIDARSTSLPPSPTGAPPAAPQPGGIFDPGSGNTSVANMVNHFNSLGSDADKANYVRAIDQYSLGKGGANNLGAALQAGLRSSMGQGAFDAWSGTNIGAQPGVISAAGLPSWLVSALGGK